MLEDVAGDLDFVLVMSVNPGSADRRSSRTRSRSCGGCARVLDAAGSSAAIEIDGGIDTANVADVVAAGATILVAGHAIFGARQRRSGDPRAARGRGAG